MPTTILEQTRTHPPRRGTGRHGQDVWEFDIPAGEQLAAVELAVEEAGLDSGARIARLENIGTVTVSKFMLKGDFYAVSLDAAVGQTFLQWATDEQRTSRQGETVNVTITPGQRRTVSPNPRPLPSSLGPFQGPAGQILNPSSKGDYLVSVSVEAITTDSSQARSKPRSIPIRCRSRSSPDRQTKA